MPPKPHFGKSPLMAVIIDRSIAICTGVPRHAGLPREIKLPMSRARAAPVRFISSGWIPARRRSRHTSNKVRQTSPGLPMVNGSPSRCQLKNRRHPSPSVARRPKVLSGPNRQLLSRPRAINTMAEASSIPLSVTCSSSLPTEV